VAEKVISFSLINVSEGKCGEEILSTKNPPHPKSLAGKMAL